jgi:hypothetical protein
MPDFYPSLSTNLADWLLRQPVFFVASAPLTGKHINVSPKGHPRRTLRVVNPNLVAYLDSTGSGCETISHIYENGRVTLMANSFGASPRILRLFCRGEVVERGCARYDEIVGLFEKKSPDADVEDWQTEAFFSGARSVILLHVFKVQTSCGYGVPRIDKDKPLDGDAFTDRDTLPNWAGKQEDRVIKAYRMKNNCRSLDGLPGLRSARRDHGEWAGVAEIGALGRRIVWAQLESLILGMVTMFLLLVILRMGFKMDVVAKMGDVIHWLTC